MARDREARLNRPKGYKPGDAISRPSQVGEAADWRTRQATGRAGRGGGGGSQPRSRAATRSPFDPAKPWDNPFSGYLPGTLEGDPYGAPDRYGDGTLEGDPYGAPDRYGSGGGGSGGRGGSLAMMTAPAIMDPLSDPGYLASLAGIDADEELDLSTYRSQQEAARRSLADLLGDIADRAIKGEGRTKESQEGRGLLRSGATERLLAEVNEAANAEKARGESSTADRVSELAAAIAQRAVDAQKERAALQLKYGGLGDVV